MECESSEKAEPGKYFKFGVRHLFVFLGEKRNVKLEPSLFPCQGSLASPMCTRWEWTYPWPSSTWLGRRAWLGRSLSRVLFSVKYEKSLLYTDSFCLRNVFLRLRVDPGAGGAPRGEGGRQVALRRRSLREALRKIGENSQNLRSFLLYKKFNSKRFNQQRMDFLLDVILIEVEHSRRF